MLQYDLVGLNTRYAQLVDTNRAFALSLYDQQKKYKELENVTKELILSNANKELAQNELTDVVKNVYNLLRECNDKKKFIKKDEYVFQLKRDRFLNEQKEHHETEKKISSR